MNQRWEEVIEIERKKEEVNSEMIFPQEIIMITTMTIIGIFIYIRIPTVKLKIPEKHF